ncbi:MAG: hypothetical protein KF850_20020 [Labilithrix sp.]|nr:hypothetical protein [Labilithrix sp.]
MSFNVVGSDGAVAVLVREVEERRLKDASYPWRFEVDENEGPVLRGDEGDLTERRRRTLIELTKRHPDIVLVTARVDRDDTGRLISVDLLRYSGGRRRIVAQYTHNGPNRRERRAKFLKVALRYDAKLDARAVS